MPLLNCARTDRSGGERPWAKRSVLKDIAAHNLAATALIVTIVYFVNKVTALEGDRFLSKPHDEGGNLEVSNQRRNGLAQKGRN